MEKSIIENILEKAKYPRISNKPYRESKKDHEKAKIEAEGEGAKSPGPKNYGYHTITEKPNMKSIIENILEKAVYGAGASGGKVQRGSGKDESKPGAVKKPALSEERKKQIIEGARTKASHLASSTGMHGLASKIKAEKSLDERTADLVKSLYDVVNRKKFSKIDPDAGINKKKEEKMNIERGPEDKGKYVPGSKTFSNPQDSQDSKIRYKSLDSDLEKAKFDKKLEKFDFKDGKKDADHVKRLIRAGRKNDNDPLKVPTPERYEKYQGKSLDDRTCDLVKDMSSSREREIHDAISTIRMTKENIPEAAKMDVNPEDVHRAHSLHTNLSAPRTQKSVCDKWLEGSAFITKGARVMPLGPGGQVQDLSKDEDEDSGAE